MKSPVELTPQVRELLARRAERLRARAATSEELETVVWLAEFPIGEERYAFPLDSVRAAIPLRMVTPVPLSDATVVGILRFQGQILTALSLVSLLGGHGWSVDPTLLLVVDAGSVGTPHTPGSGRLVAIDCEQAPRPTSLPLRVVEEARSQSQWASVIDVTTPDMRQIHLIDLARLLEGRHWERDAG